MATNSSQLQEAILKAIDAVVTQRNNDLQLDKTILGTVKKNVGKRGNRPLYQVEYGGGIIEAVAQSSEDVYSPRTSVYVLIPQGNFSNEKIIVGRGSMITTDRSTSVVSAAVNNYSIVGANLLEPVSKEEKIKDIEYGLRSFHPIFRDSIEENGINHRAYFLYRADDKDNSRIKFNDEKLDIYKEDSTAIMVRADFKTNLDAVQKQQPNAKYGLIFNFAFDNLNKGYGETNGEILSTVGKIVSGTIVDTNGAIVDKTLEDIVLSFEERLNGSSVENLTLYENYISQRQEVLNSDTLSNNDKIQFVEDISDILVRMVNPTTSSSFKDFFIEQHQNYLLQREEILTNENLSETEKTQQITELWNGFESNMNNISFENTEIDFWTRKDIGILDQTKELIQSLYNNFEDSKLNNEIVQNTVQAYLILLQNLKTCSSISEIATEYTLWKEEIVGDDSQKYIQFVLSSDNMIGNPFNFNVWNTQYSIFNLDLNTFNHLDSILFYKEGFFTDTETTRYEYQWPIGSNGGGPDIFVRNLQVYAMNPLDNKSGDYTLNIQPYGDCDIFVSKDSPSTTFKATLLRKLFEDLTANDKTNFFWFKEDSSVINSDSKNYNYLGGSGWRQLDHPGINYLFTTTIEDNYAYKNNYKCVAIYEPARDDKTVLNFTFSVYNKDMSIDIKLESDLGTNFSFDKGKPTVKVLINEDRENADSSYIEQGFGNEVEHPKYLYAWTINDAANNYTLFLDEIIDTTIQENSSVSSAIILSSKQSLLKRIELFNLTEATNDSTRATRVKYPVSISSSGFIITCYVKKYNENTEKYYDIGSASLEFENKTESITSGYHIHIVNGDQVFQYDEYGNTPCSQKVKNPLVIKPLQAKLFTPSGLEVEGTNYQVEWIFPIEATMISTPEQLLNNPATGLIQSYIGSEINFNIAELYDPNAYANQITCHIHFADVDYYKDTNFYFGKQGNNGTNGTDTVAKIEYNGDDTTKILSKQPLTLYVQKEINDSEVTASAMINIGPRKLKDSILLANTNFNGENDDNAIFKLSVYQKEKLIGADNYKTGYPKWNLAGNLSETTNKDGKFFKLESDTNSLNLSWQYDEESQNKSYLLQNIRASVQLKTDQMYYAFFSLPIIEYEPAVLPVSVLPSINTIAIDKNFYLNEIVYNADGRNPVYNHNQGLKLYNIPSNITKIEWSVKGGLVKEENTPWISLLEEKGSDKGESNIVWTSEDENWEEKFKDNQCMIYVLPNDIFDGSATNNRIEVKLYQSEDQNYKLIATVYAPINMTLNTFGLSSLNAWDGNTVTIDNDGGYIMAPQIGAGEKDDNNRFTGILMGKTETYTGGGDKEKQTGLFGYTHGLQSIFLDSETGNATFGLPDVDTELDQNGNIVYKNYHNTSVQGSDDYNEGRIELRPGDISKIGGWRLGRRSFYYIEDDKDIGPKYNNDYIPDRTGTIKFGNRYNSHHEKDIQEDSAGVLLHSGKYPYLSIKGKKLDIEKDQLSDSSLSYLLDGDSLEVQIDPYTPTLFTIFRHNGQARYKDAEKTQLLYPEGSRTYLAGINARGQLVANGLQNVTTPTSDSEGDTVTTFGVNAVPAFGEYFENATHIGLMMDAADQMISKIFVKNIQEKDSTLYITGSGTQNNEYIRPISMHGKNISLYVSSDASTETTTTSNIKISTTNAQINLGDTKLNLYKDENYINSNNVLTDRNNSLTTMGQITINSGAADNRKAFNLNASNIAIKLYTGSTNYYSKTINPGSADSSGSISVVTDNNFNHRAKGPRNIRFYTDSTKEDKSSTESPYFQLNSNRTIKLGYDYLNNDKTETIYKNLITMENDGDSIWEASHDLTLQNSNQLRITATNNGNGAQYTTAADSYAQILIQAGTTTTNQTAAQLFLNSSNNTWTSTYKQKDGKVTPKNGSKENSWFRVNETRANQGIFLYDTIDSNTNTKYTYFGVDAHESDFSSGVRIQGNVDSNPITGINTGLTVKNAIYTSAPSKYTFNSISFSGTSGNITCNIKNITNLEDAINALATKIAEVADKFNKHTHHFSDSSSETVSWTAPTHTVLSSVSGTASRDSLAVTGLGGGGTPSASFGNPDDTNLATITVEKLDGSTKTGYRLNNTGEKYLEGATNISLKGSTTPVGGESYSETVKLEVDQIIGVPNDQKIKDSDF